MGPFLMGSQGYKYLFVVVDYFAKWEEAKALRSITEDSVIQFMLRSIVYRFGVPLQVISNNGTQFTDKKLRKLCEDNGIKLSFVPVYHPQANG